MQLAFRINLLASVVEAIEGNIGMNFSNRTIYDKDRLIRFNMFSVLRKRLFWSFMILSTALVSVSFALTLALEVYDFTMSLCFALIVFIDITYVFCWLILPRITINRSAAINADVLFEFQEDIFKITAEAKNGRESSEMNYSAIKKIMESDRDIYLYTSAYQAYILDKTAFSIGSPDEFVEFIKGKNIPYKK